MAILTVQTLDDEDDGTTDINDLDLSLREATRLAGANFSEDTINFRADLAGGTVTLTQGQIDIRVTTIARALTIDGDIDNDQLPDITIDAQGQSRVLNVNPMAGSNTIQGSPVTLDGLVVTGGRAFQDAGISVVSTPFTLVSSTVRNNEAVGGAGGIGINNVFGGPVEVPAVIMDSTISENTAGSNGGGIIFRRAFVHVINSTISENSANDGNGGGIYGFQARDLTLVNSTVSGNRATGNGEFDGRGGGIYTSSEVDNSDIILINATISGNHVTGPGAMGGGVFQGFQGSLDLQNSIVAGNAAGNLIDDIAGPIGTSNGANIFSEANLADAVIGDQQGVNPALVFDNISQIGSTGVFAGVLANNGGPTQTIALEPTGLAVDVGGDVSLEAPGLNRRFEGPGASMTDDVPLRFDQRGPNFDRIVDLPGVGRDLPGVGSRIDVGAFEVQELPVTEIPSTSGDDFRNGTGGRDTFAASAGDDKINGLGGDDSLNGGEGDDELDGGSGDDVLDGGSGNDELDGGSGDDVLDGGADDDVLRGGSGVDIFRFDDDSGGFDTIQDFSRGGGDRLELDISEATFRTAFGDVVNAADPGVDALDPDDGRGVRGGQLVIDFGDPGIPGGAPGDSVLTMIGVNELFTNEIVFV